MRPSGMLAMSATARTIRLGVGIIGTGTPAEAASAGNYVALGDS